jgi:tRNA nucleotidyltransferase (CCA-adding enzyme)
VQFAARLEFDIDPDTVSLCRSIDLGDLPAERIWGEMEKLLVRARRPSKGLEWAAQLGVIDQLFPELKALMGCPQEPDWHPEGDVWVHTLLAIDRAREESEGLPLEKRLAVMLAVLCHDFGKPATTSVVDGRIRSFEHEEAGVEPTVAFLDRLRIRTLNGYPLREQVIELVARHLTPSHWYKNRDNVGDGAVRRLARKLEPELLYLVSRADCLGRTGIFSTDAQEWFIDRVRGLGVEERPPEPILMGRHLLEMGLLAGPIIGRITRAVYEMQLDGSVTDLEGARREARRLIDQQADEPTDQ